MESVCRYLGHILSDQIHPHVVVLVVDVLDGGEIVPVPAVIERGTRHEGYLHSLQRLAYSLNESSVEWVEQRITVACS